MFEKDFPAGGQVGRAKQRLMLKFGASQEEADLAEKILRANFDLKEKFPDELWVIPQIPDWLWHELISVTVDYRTFFANKNGPSHQVKPAPSHNAVEPASHNVVEPGEHVCIEDAATPDGRTRDKGLEAVGRFEQTLERLTTDYDADCYVAGWTESGWNTPRYRFVQDHYYTFDKVDLSETQRNGLASLKHDTQIDLSIFEERIMRRYGLSAGIAELAVISYQAFLNARRDSKVELIMPELTSWVWFEHVIWTDKYRADCETHFQEFLDRPDMANHNVIDKVPDWLGDFGKAGLMGVLTKAGWAVPA